MKDAEEASAPEALAPAAHVKDAEKASAPEALAPAGAKGSALAMAVNMALAQAKAKAAVGKRYMSGIPAPRLRIWPYDPSTSIGAFSAASSDAAADAGSDEQVPDDSNEWYMIDRPCSKLDPRMRPWCSFVEGGAHFQRIVHRKRRRFAETLLNQQEVDEDRTAAIAEQANIPKEI